MKMPCVVVPLAVLALCLISPVKAQVQDKAEPIDPAYQLTTVPLWNGPAPGAKGSSEDDVPTLTVFPARDGNGNGTGVVIAPGGAYLRLAANHEGRQVADWFNAHGITAFVLKYRVGSQYLYPAPLVDARRALRLARYLAPQFHVNASRIGMMGFSAGGHLTAAAGTLFEDGQASAADPVERFRSRPDFIILAYPWLDAMQPAHEGYIPSYQDLMKIPKEQQAAYEAPYSPVAHVTAQTPPAFIFITGDDGTVYPPASIEFYSALRAKGVSAELHVFRHGPHGIGLDMADPVLGLWPVLLEAWLRDQGLL